MDQVRRPSGARQVELVDAALEIIARQGVHALTTRSLAEAVGLTTGAIFRHFASLDALLSAVVTRVEAVLDETYPAEGAPEQRLTRFVEARSAAVGGRRGVLRLLLSEQFQLALPARDAARLTRAVSRTRGFLVELLEEGQASGAFRADVPPQVLAPIVMGTTQMLALANHAGPGSASVLHGLLRLLAPALPEPTKRKRSSR